METCSVANQINIITKKAQVRILHELGELGDANARMWGNKCRDEYSPESQHAP